eukprot:NODE_3058_length_836_cov_195.430218.p1 GENE.NODE_3058_length_836_cov_195.430218~~NODE_3058_length_836_cov_195.430218.p1  ORF type:complete len:233 (+),score=48.02 NODE_3058_length_836_cov_195.430218:3-701(+)
MGSKAIYAFFSSGVYGPSVTKQQQDEMVKAVLAAQGGFMRVLLGIECPPEVTITSALWMAGELDTFKSGDLDGNGFLDAAELASAMEASVTSEAANFATTTNFAEMADHFISAFDLQPDGKISPAEWLVARAAWLSTHIATQFYMPQPLPAKIASGTCVAIPPMAPLPDEIAPMPMAMPRSKPLRARRPAIREKKKKKKKKTSDLVVAVGLATGIFAMGFLAGLRRGRAGRT